MHDVPVDNEWDEHLDGDVIRTTPGPAVQLDVDGWAAFLASRSKNFRGQVRGKRNRLERAFEMSIRTSTPDTLEQDMTTLLSLHRLRWGADAPFARGKQAELARRFARLSIERDRLRLSVMELDGRPVAALLGLRFAGVHSFWQSGRDPAYEEHSIGSVLLMDAIREAAEDHALEYRLLRGGETYKQRLADRARDTCTIAVGRGAFGAVAINAAHARRAGQRHLKALRASITAKGRPGDAHA
ncbi:MAG: GNAT family N-acetyltransferase [Nocardioidaceae bacterium]|nr:GNAT family N-acetyltransferase [Nocardioidaceae bacterium]